MSIRKISAPYIFDGDKMYRNATLLVDDRTIVSINDNSNDGEYYEGLIMPGFINTHCHLELSHLIGKVPTGTGLLTFLNGVISLRDTDQCIIMEAIEAQDKYMFDQGIQAVGDISNKIDTELTKSKSAIQYYTFVEMFDLMQKGLTEPSYNQYYEVYERFEEKNGNRKSAVPHAPYTVTKGLFSKINALNVKESTVSIHNQETMHEDRLFVDKSGGFPEFFGKLGLDFSSFSSIGKRSIYYALAEMDKKQKTLFVHNTLTELEDIKKAHEWNKNTYWATCANANLYIENALPNYQNFIDVEAKMTIGTDSLTSNWQLSILEELKTIQKYNSYIPTELLLKWATKNGAEALSFDDTLGSFEKGKTPGVILIENFDGTSFQGTSVKRIV